MRSLLILCSKKEITEKLSECLEQSSQIDLAKDADEAHIKLQERAHNILFFDVDLVKSQTGRLESIGALESMFNRFWYVQGTLEIIAMSSIEKIRDAVRAVKAGATDYITYPFHPEEIQMLVDDVYEERLRRSELTLLRDQFWAADAADDIKTQSESMKKVLDQIKSVAPTKSTILLTGETGTGKTRLAKLIHRHSSRKDGPFISVNCGAIPDTLIESELFGHEKGAFTGAIRLKLGKFEIAKGGTLFLDEIGTISPAAQVRLLTVIQDCEFQRVGGETTIPTDIRLIAATNTDLEQLVETGDFRKDLYYRLNVFPIVVPRLIERRNDIPLLVESLIQKFNTINNKSIKKIHPPVLSALQAYSWPGNIRELENVIEHAHILETSSKLTAESFPQEIVTNIDAASTVALDFSQSLSDVRRQMIDEVERRYLKDLLERHSGRISPAADEAGISPRQLNKLLHKYEIRKEEFKRQKLS